MSQPRILMSGKTKLEHYFNAFTGAGADPKVEYLPEFDTSYDALVLCGGSDIDPKYYNEPINGSVEIDEARDTLEFKLLEAYLDAGKPVFGICRGYQLLNIYFGGSMIQHIPEASIHTCGQDHYLSHNVTAVEGSVLHRLYGKEFPVNSAHHQVVNRLGNDLRPTAYWKDTYVEAFEHKTLPVLGVQWHPERMCFGQRREDTVDGAPLIEYFVNLCRK